MDPSARLFARLAQQSQARADTHAVTTEERVQHLENKVEALTDKVNIVVETVTTQEERLRDVQAELKHYGHVVSNVTQHLTDNQKRQNLVFQGLAFCVVGLLLWIVSRIA